MNQSLEGQVAIVTGAARGIGRAFCQALAAEGVSIVACDRYEAERLPVAAKSRDYCREQGGIFEEYLALEEISGQSCGLHHVGGLTLATTPDRIRDCSQTGEQITQLAWFVRP